MLSSWRVGITELVRARWLVALGQIQSALLVPTVLANWVNEVVQLVVFRDPATGLVDAAGDIVHAVGASQGQLARVEEAAAFVGRAELVVHLDATAVVRVLGGRCAES